MKAEVYYVIGKTGIKYYHYEISGIGMGLLDQEAYDAIRYAFNNPIISTKHIKENNGTI